MVSIYERQTTLERERVRESVIVKEGIIGKEKEKGEKDRAVELDLTPVGKHSYFFNFRSSLPPYHLHLLHSIGP